MNQIIIHLFIVELLLKSSMIIVSSEELTALTLNLKR